ncbi:MAG: glycosyltransferase family 61 protein [Desulfovibrio sp.]|nr:glycosyltransferase family 61 protein [Desulfovibrio sp.]
MTSLYIDNKRAEIERFLEESFVKKERLGCPLYTDTYILPCKRVPYDTPDVVLQGGVCTKDFKFLAGLVRNEKFKYLNFSVRDSYIPKNTNNLETIDSCIFGGVIITLFGHCIVESLSRLWFLHEETLDKTLPIVFVRFGEMQKFVYEIFDLLGIRERARVIEKPVFAKSVFIPDQSNQIGCYVNTEHYRKIFDVMIANAGSPEEGQSKKIYLSRSQLSNKDCIGELFFENFFKSYNYDIVYPEKLSIAEQIRKISHADEIVCDLGTLSHSSILFCKDNAKLTFLLRDIELAGIKPQIILDNIKNCDISYVDISFNFLPTTHARGIFLLYPTENFKKYLKENHFDAYEEKITYNISDYIYDYIIKYTENYNKNEYPYKRLKNYDFFDLINCMSTVLVNKKLSRETFSTPSKASLQKKLDFFESLTNALSKSDQFEALLNEDNSRYTLLHIRLHDDSIEINNTTRIAISKVVDELSCISQHIDASWGKILPILYIGLLFPYHTYDLLLFDNKSKKIEFQDTVYTKLIESKYDIALHCFPLKSPIKDQFLRHHSKTAWNTMISNISQYDEYRVLSYVLKTEQFLFDSNIMILRPNNFSEYFKWFYPIIIDTYRSLGENDRPLIQNIAERVNTLYFYSINIKNYNVLSFDDAFLSKYKVQSNNTENAVEPSFSILKNTKAVTKKLLQKFGKLYSNFKR